MKRFLIMGSLAALGSIAYFTIGERALAETSSAQVVNRTCSRCHALEIMGQCLAGDCEGNRVVRLSEPAPWNLVLEWMTSMGAKISDQDAKSILLFLEAKFPPKNYPLSWEKIKSPINVGGWNVVSLKSDGTAIYAGFEGNGKIFRSLDGAVWKEVEATEHNTVYGIISFQGRLYAGANDPDALVLTSMGGTDWTTAAQFGEGDQGVISLGTFAGDLFAGTGSTALYRSSDGKEWKQAGLLIPNATHGISNWIRFLIQFENRLYAGIEKGPLFWSSNGLDWAPVKGNLGGLPGFRGAAVFDGGLYVGTTGSGQVWRTLDGSRWKAVFNAPPHIHRGYVASMTVASGSLFISVDGYVFRTSNGTNWEEVGHLSPFTIESMAFFQRRLYAGTLLPPAGQIYRTRIEPE